MQRWLRMMWCEEKRKATTQMELEDTHRVNVWKNIISHFSFMRQANWDYAIRSLERILLNDEERIKARTISIETLLDGSKWESVNEGRSVPTRWKSTIKLVSSLRGKIAGTVKLKESLLLHWQQHDTSTVAWSVWILFAGLSKSSTFFEV